MWPETTHCNKQEEELKCIFLSSTLENTESQSRSGAQISAFPHFSTPLLPTQQFSCTLSVLRTIHWLRGKDPTSKDDLQFIAWPHSIKLVHSLIFWPSWTLRKWDRAGCHGSWMFLQVFFWKHKLRLSGVLFILDFWRRQFPSHKPGHQTIPPPHTFIRLPTRGWGVANCERTWNLRQGLCPCSGTLWWHWWGRLMVGGVTSWKHDVHSISSSCGGRERVCIPKN